MAPSLAEIPAEPTTVEGWMQRGLCRCTAEQMVRSYTATCPGCSGPAEPMLWEEDEAHHQVPHTDEYTGSSMAAIERYTLRQLSKCK